MNRSNLVMTIIFGVVGLLLLLLFIFNDEKRYNWFENYRADSEEPYGTSFIQKLLASQHSSGNFIMHDKKPLKLFLENEAYQENTNFIFIGRSLYLTKDDEAALTDFVERGNDVFISANEIPEFVDYWYSAECDSAIILDDNTTTSVTMNFFHPTFFDKYGYKYSYRFMNGETPYNWATFHPAVFCDSTKSVTPLGYLEPQRVNFIKIALGKGSLYLHSNPLVFTNYFLIKKQKADYASAVFSHLRGTKSIWDEYGKLPVLDGGGENDNPLYFIMQQPALKYAWWMLALTVILYAFFAAKRLQRVIPVLEEKTNTSLEFVRMISALHYQNRNHLDMARKKMKYFQYFVRSRYGIHIHPYSEDMVERVSEKSKVAVNDVKAIFNLHKLIEEGSGGYIEAPRLTNFYYAIENFYKHCK